ncbi:hypothetical protein TNCV_2668121 [Trichonephila clavipes]|nr:hypothetical protein TNCV_2668121 [Trichonephila clavipes]
MLSYSDIKRKLETCFRSMPQKRYVHSNAGHKIVARQKRRHDVNTISNVYQNAHHRLHMSVCFLTYDNHNNSRLQSVNSATACIIFQVRIQQISIPLLERHVLWVNNPISSTCKHHCPIRLAVTILYSHESDVIP